MWMMIEAIRAGLAERADPVKAPEMQRYMKSEMPFRGVQKPERVKLAREVFVELPREEWERAVRTLWREATFREERYMALAVLQGPSLPRVPRPRRAAALRGADRDRRVVGLRGRGRVPGRSARCSRTWRPCCASGRSDDGPVEAPRVDHRPGHGARRETDFALMTDCIEPNRGDREFFIRKAIGWALRSYAWVDAGRGRRVLRHPRARSLEPARGVEEHRSAAVG